MDHQTKKLTYQVVDTNSLSAASRNFYGHPTFNLEHGDRTQQPVASLKR